MPLGSNFQVPAMLHLCLWVVASNNMDIKSYQIYFNFINRSCFTILPLANLKLAELRSKPLGKERKVSRHQVVQDHSRLVYQDHLCLIIQQGEGQNLKTELHQRLMPRLLRSKCLSSRSFAVEKPEHCR